MGPTDPAFVQNNSPHTDDSRAPHAPLYLEGPVALLALFGLTVLIFVLTFFYFRAFRMHRQILEERWYVRGKQDLASGHPQEAARAFRSALTLDLGNRTYELALANALAKAGKTDEAYAYYSSLHETRPGDGLLDLELARLAVKKNMPEQAVAFYQAALEGNWLTDGVSRRREARLELARYFLSLDRPMQAQEQLLTAEGNAMLDPALTNQIAALLMQAGSSGEALQAYQRAQHYARPNSREMLRAYLGAEQAAIQLGEYKQARTYLERYLARVGQVSHAPMRRAEAEAELDQLQRLLALDPSADLPPKTRAQHLLAAAAIAHKRFNACNGQVQSSGAISMDAATFSFLAPQWQSMDGLRLAKLMATPTLQDTLQSLIDKTETLAKELCGPPQGDDALLLQLATVPDKAE